MSTSMNALSNAFERIELPPGCPTVAEDPGVLDLLGYPGIGNVGQTITLLRPLEPPCSIQTDIEFTCPPSNAYC